jgi:hypothetical protein
MSRACIFHVIQNGAEHKQTLVVIFGTYQSKIKSIFTKKSNSSTAGDVRYFSRITFLLLSFLIFHLRLHGQKTVATKVEVPEINIKKITDLIQVYDLKVESFTHRSFVEAVGILNE